MRNLFGVSICPIFKQIVRADFKRLLYRNNANFQSSRMAACSSHVAKDCCYFDEIAPQFSRFHRGARPH